MGEEKYKYGSPENRDFLKEEAEKIIQFGKGFLSSSGGSYYLGDDGRPWKERDRETWITCRMAHVYSTAYLLTGNEDYRSLACNKKVKVKNSL